MTATPMQDIADKLRRAARRGEQLRLPAELVQALYSTAAPGTAPAFCGRAWHGGVA